MDRELLKLVIADQEELPFPRDFFDRSQSAVIRTFIDDPNVVIISGLRRSGKSTIMQVLQREQKEKEG